MNHEMKVRGVNLGNWLVLEKWMSPHMFEGTDAADEYHLARQLAPEVYRERICRHREEYITEYDFAWLAKNGFTTVRIPIPYFIFGDRAPYVGCIENLDHAFDWAEKWGLQILIDLHTVPGSQNGFDNGGICGVCKWAEMSDEIEFVLELLEKLARRYGHRKGLWGIEPLNEPITNALVGDAAWKETWIYQTYPSCEPELTEQSAPIKMEFLRQFYIDAYHRIMKHVAADKYFVFHDAFRTKMWTDFMQEEEFQNVVLDTHLYLSNVEMGGVEKSLEGYVKVLQGHFQPLMKEMGKHFMVVCGEWCLDNSYVKSLTDAEEQKKVYQVLAKEQIAAWNCGNGFFYWNYKLLAEESGLDCWDIRKSVLQKWFPVEEK